MRHAKRSKVSRPDISVIGFDSETLQGPPITFQFFSKEHKRITGCVFIGEKSAVRTFLQQLKKLPAGRYRMYGHNLEFDMLSALWEERASIRDGNIDLTIDGWEITGRYSKPVFANFNDGKRHIELVDSFLWFMTSLENAAKKVCPDLPKLMRPQGLGLTLYSRTDTGFVEYAMRDAEVAYHLGLAIERFHEELEVAPQISLASMAAAVFRSTYLQDNIYQPPLYQWMVGAAAAYHGGVNRVRPGASMTWHKNVTALDVSSAYPHAMHGFPDFSNVNGYKSYKSRKANKLRSVPDLGVYCLTGKSPKCDWPALFDHNFKGLQGAFEDIWVSGYELNEAIRSDEVKISRISGYHYDSVSYTRKGKHYSTAYSPFRAFVDEFYRLKSEAADPVMRYMYKILLNALTGKFIQTSPDYTLVDGKLVKIHRAGGLYHPFIAGLITGHTRATMHALEHEHEALHTATDGIFAPGNIRGAKQKTLGAIVSEGNGDLALFRNKLYIFYTGLETEGSYPSQVFEGRHILKCARHGFQGRVVDLEKMLINVNRTYKVNKPIKLKSAIKNKEVPNKFVTTERNLNVGDNFKVITYGKKDSIRRHA